MWLKNSALHHTEGGFDLAGFADSSDVLPVYIGDDRTDEDAFEVWI
jgi:trehalose 6-phosphate phosphatase